MTVRFRIRAADGREVVGPVQGSGGKVGDGLAHLNDKARQEKDAFRRMLRAIDAANEGRDTGLYEPAPGCVSVSPHYDEVEGDYGRERVTVSLVGATVTLAR